MPETIVEFQNVSYSVGTMQILEDLNLQVFRGEILILLGESGCGKTTTLKLINRLIEPTAGKVLVRGRPTTVWDAIRLRRSIGYVLQEGGLFPHFSVEKNVALVAELVTDFSKEKDRKKRGIHKRVSELLEMVGLDPDKFSERFPHELSGGQRQRVGVARALAADPDLLLLDEPFGALDAITRARLQKEFSELVKKLNKTAVFVTHDLHEAFALGTRICLMDKGRVALVETPENFRRSGLPLVREYMETI
jgi:osmoprotectant transport system ATP-binding protein